MKYSIHWAGSDGTTGHGTGLFSWTKAHRITTDLNNDPNFTTIKRVTYDYRVGPAHCA